MRLLRRVLPGAKGISSHDLRRDGDVPGGMRRPFNAWCPDAGRIEVRARAAAECQGPFTPVTISREDHQAGLQQRPAVRSIPPRHRARPHRSRPGPHRAVGVLRPKTTSPRGWRRSSPRGSGASKAVHQGVFRLTQAMGGGRPTPDRARSPRPAPRAPGAGHGRLLPPRCRPWTGPGVAFSGRESDAPLGIWGAIAEQLGRRDQLTDYYSPLAAPGQTAWVNLLRGEPLIIMLDELPPYLVNAAAKTIGDSNLARVTTALSTSSLRSGGTSSTTSACPLRPDRFYGAEGQHRERAPGSGGRDRPQRHEPGARAHEHGRALRHPAQAPLRDPAGGGRTSKPPPRAMPARSGRRSRWT